jgi:DNA-binding NtrC family response regulator
MSERILVVDDDPSTLELYAEALKRAGYEPLTSDSGQGAEAILQTEAVDAIVVDLRMPNMGGLELLQAAKDTDPNLVAVLMTGYPTVETAVEAMKFGASEYLVKPFSPEQLIRAVRSGLDVRRTKEAHGLLRSQLRRAFGVGGMLGQTQGMQRLFEDVRRAAAVDAAVLILGESGAGKELVARAVHENSPRQGKPFLAINCAAIPENLLESELFGHERGAFTGAVVSRPGLLETAAGGTMFLDEVCDLGVPLQSKLLRALEESSLRRLGGRSVIPLNVRFVAATNRDIHEEVRRGRFREDLFFRLDVIQLQVPPLRDRREDIPLLATSFLESCSARLGKQIEGVTAEAMQLLVRYDWPGNVRELKNAVERAVAYAQGPLVTAADLPQAVMRDAQTEPPTFRQWKERTLERLERDFLEKALEEHGGNITHAAQALGIHRSTLQRLLRRLKPPVA